MRSGTFFFDLKHASEKREPDWLSRKGTIMAESDKTNSRLQEFQRGLKSEFHKIVWPTRELLIKQTVSVLAVSVFLGVVISLLDWGFQWGLTRLFQ